MAETQKNGKGTTGTIAGILAGVVAAIVGGAKSCGREAAEHPGRYFGPGISRGIYETYKSNQDKIRRSYYPSTYQNGNSVIYWKNNKLYTIPASRNNWKSEEK